MDSLDSVVPEVVKPVKSKPEIKLSVLSKTGFDPDFVTDVIKACKKTPGQLIQAGIDQNIIDKRILLKHLQRHFGISRNEAILRAGVIFKALGKATLQEMTSLVNEVKLS